MPPEIEINVLSASPKTVEMLSKILVETVANGGSVSFMHPLAQEVAAAFWDSAFAAAAEGKRIILGAWDADVLVGTVTLLLDCPPNQPHRAEIAKLTTRLSCRGRGVATALMQAAEEQAKERRRTLLVLDTAADGGASSLYERLGFTLAGTIPDYALKPHGGLTGTMIYWKRLEESTGTKEQPPGLTPTMRDNIYTQFNKEVGEARMTEKRSITAEDVLTLQNVGDVQVSPDGLDIVFVRTTTNSEKNKYQSELWRVPTDGSRPAQQFTHSSGSDSSLRWSPEGSQIAFVSDRVDETVQIFLIAPDGGEARALTTLDPGGVQSLHWSPDGTKIAFLYRATPAAYKKKAIEERKEKGLSSPPRVHTHLFYRLDGFGYFDGEFWQVAVADVTTGETKTLTSGDFSCSSPTWSPDSKAVAFLSDRRPDGDALPEANTQVWTVPADGGELTQIPAPDGDKSGLCWSPDGTQFAYTGNPDAQDQWGTNNDRVFVLPSGGGEARDLTGHTDLAVGNLAISDVGGGDGEELAWSEDGASLYFPVSQNGDVRLYRLPLSSGEMTALTPANQVIGAFSMAGEVFAVSVSTSTAPGEIFAGSRQVTSLNQAWLDTVALQVPEPFSIDNGSGGTVPGWFLMPPNFKADGTAPLVLYVHGGPHLQYGNMLFHELQWLAAQGYVVAYANPLGSKGYGEAHTKAIKGDWGGPALADMEAVADEAIRRGYADPKKTAIMGGSYGGYLTAWAIGHTDRFACAIADRLVNNLQSMAGTCDFPWSHSTYYKGNAWDDPSDLWHHSPMAYAGKIHTPLLLIHSDGDLRCPVSQAEELFAALRLQRKPVEFVRYPAETSHGLSRNGPPDLRLDRLQRNLAWLNNYLK